MVEVVHIYSGSYPFGKQKESEQTFMEFNKKDLGEEEVSLYRKIAKTYKQINSPHFHKLVKVFREEEQLFFLYQYEPLSL